MTSDVLVAVGSNYPNHKKGEIFEDGAWSDIEDAPPRMTLNNYAVVYSEGSFYYFGGLDNYGVGSLNKIHRLSSASWTWSIVGRLNLAGYAHSVIKVDNTFMSVGGHRDTEACTLEDDSFTCERNSGTALTYNFPILVPVSDDYDNC